MGLDNIVARLSSNLQKELSGLEQKILGNTEILREGQFIKVVPIVTKGLIKVYTKKDDKILLLYYIKAGESCIMSYSSSLKNEASQIFAVTIEETTAILIPVERIKAMEKEKPEINAFFIQLFSLRYNDLLDTIHQVLFNKMDQRLIRYLYKKSELLESKKINLSHKQIADELGTAREVISRVMKKLENEKLIKQHQKMIEIL